MSRSPGRFLDRGPLSLLAVVAAVVVLAAGAPVWVRAGVRTAIGVTEVSATGRGAAPLATALGLVGLAAVLASLIGRRFSRTVAALLLVVAGAGVVASSLSVVTDAAGAADAVSGQARQAASISSAEVDDVRVAAWPWVSGAGGLLLALAGVGLVLRSQRPTPPRTQRFERAPADSANLAGPADPAGPANPAGPARREPPSEDPAAAWDDLTRGGDPTR